MTSAARPRSSVMLPSPPHCATSCPPGRSAACRRAKQPIVIGDPVEGRGREDRIHGLVQLELEQVRRRACRRRAEPLAAALHHRRRRVDRDHPPARQAFDQRLGDPPRAAARVEHHLVAAELAAGRGPRGPEPPSARRFGRSSARPTRVSLAYARTLSRTLNGTWSRVDPARVASSARHLRELPPLPGDRRARRGPHPRRSAARPGSPARSARPTASGWPGSASSRLATTIVGDVDRRASSLMLSNGRERGTTSSASATASGCSCAAVAGARPVSTVSRQAPGTPERS